MIDDIDLLRMENAKLRAALALAPRPKTNVNADWLVLYMDWFFQMRIEALGN